MPRIRSGLRHASRPFLIVAMVCAPTAVAFTQDPIRPGLDWRTIETRNYRFHFPRALEDWTVAVAERVESIDSTLVRLIGHAPPRPVDVVIDDPFSISNGYALPFIDRPVTVWWAMPADPRTDIGNYRTWGEMLSVHELAHITHMTRPSRNPLQRQLWSSLPVNLGPVTRHAPRWVYEGYATYVEGRVTGTGRPNNVWRAALMRQWAIEGRLPTYGQLNFSTDFLGGDFAYLGGSAFLDWLTHRYGGDSSLAHLWRRLSARRVRSFESAFSGVFGDAPALLYGRHVADVTRDAMAAKAALERAGLVEGALIQRLTWGTGDPAIAPDGSRVAVVLRERDRPGRVVVWSTAPEPPDTAAARRRVELLKRDPEDVPDRSIYPPAKRAQKTLLAWNGRSFQLPPWFVDGRRVLLTRWTPKSDGSASPALYVWDTDTGRVRRVTGAVGLQNADPHPNSTEAIAMQCRSGRCDLARVDLGSGRATTILRGDVRRSYYRPRYSPDGALFAASVSDSGRWRILVADSDGRNARYVDPDDGANRYDAEWLRGGDALVVVSERGGIPNLELLDLAGGTRTLTRVTGAALAPAVHPADSSIWFLSLHSRGLDVRRLGLGATRPVDPVVDIGADRFGFAGMAGIRVAPQFEVRPIPTRRAYGSGPRHQRWLPGVYASADGAGVFVSVFSGDIIGRLNVAANAAFGEAGTESGGSVRLVWRHPTPWIEMGGFGLTHQPSRGRFAQASDSLDTELFHGTLAMTGERHGDGWFLRARGGIGAGMLQPRLGTEHFRGLGFAEIDLRLSQSRGARGLVERLRFLTAQGHTMGHYHRTIGTLELHTAGRDMLAVQLGATLGRMNGSPHPFEQFTIGGPASPVADSSLLGQRYHMPMFPTGTAVGKEMFAWRAAVPSSLGTLFYEGASVSPGPFSGRQWHRAAGLELRYAMPPIPPAFAPRVDIRGGAAYLLDDPFRKKVRLFVEMRIEP
jgi:hypothetical protein